MYSGQMRKANFLKTFGKSKMCSNAGHQGRIKPKRN